jgi:ABC-type transport system involved in cytochrome bd biosynthesis fused ATPase/permease subunit
VDAATTGLLDATTGRTVVLITHRPCGLDRVDAVIDLGLTRLHPSLTGQLVEKT